MYFKRFYFLKAWFKSNRFYSKSQCFYVFISVLTMLLFIQSYTVEVPAYE